MCVIKKNKKQFASIQSLLKDHYDMYIIYLFCRSLF